MPALASAARYGSRTLETGKSGSDVKRLQRYLILAGHRIGADGEFGRRTKGALKATERGLELRADGMASRLEQRVIRGAIATGSGGAAYIPPPPVKKVVLGVQGKVTDVGFALPPASAPQVVKDVIAAGNRIAKTPYKWGGGHGMWEDTGYDCSGSVSYALHGGNLLVSPLVSGGFSSWGVQGLGRWITIYANGGHVYMVVAGLRFDTSARSRTGSRWTTEQRSPAGFTITHPANL